MDTPNQQTDAPTQPTTHATPTGAKLHFVLGMLLAFLVVGVGLGAYYLGTKNSQPSLPATTQTSPTTSPSGAPVQSWVTKTYQLNKESAVSGKETITLSWQMPSDWEVHTYSQPANPNNMIKNCQYYALTSADKITSITISPICAGWAATYTPWQANVVVVKDSDPEDIVRYPGLHDHTFNYAHAFKTEQVQDALMIPYGNVGNFLPIDAGVVATNTAPDTTTADKIIASITAK